MTKTTGEDYLLGTGDAEFLRLASQHRAWASQAFALWERAEFRRGDRLLDLGCGPGFATLDLAHLVGPRGEIVAADASARFLDHLRRLAEANRVDWVRPMQADARDLRLPGVEAGSLDGAYCRWMLCYLERPEEAVCGVSRHLRPGGRFAVTDYFNYRAFTLAPHSAAFERVVSVLPDVWRESGGDLDVGGRLPGLMRDCGLELVHVDQVVRTTRPGTPLWAWPETFFRGFLPRMVEDGHLEPAEAEAFWHDWEAREKDPDAFLALPPLMEVVGEKRG